MDQDDLPPGAHSPDAENSRSRNRVFKTGETFGNFRIVRCICMGTYANFYSMQHVRDLHEVTVVVFHQKTQSDPDFFDRLKELQARMKKFKYERFPKIEECAEIRGHHCLFLQPVEGMSLSNYLNEQATPGESGLGPDRTSRILAQLHGAVGYAHTAGFLHLDLSSDMIFINQSGNIQILGLGLKTVLGIDLFEAIVSATVSPLANKEAVAHLTSFDVLSPEYSLAVREETRSDIYAIGMLGYWLLTGRKPRPSNLTPASELVEFLPKNWDRFFERSMVRDKEERYRSCKVALLGLKEADPETESDRSHFVQRHIDRIPVPKGIRQRGSSATSVYRLSVIGLVGVTLVGLAASLFTSIFSNAGKSLEVTRVTDEADADIILKIKPSRAKVLVEGTNYSFLATNGSLMLDIPPGEHRLKVSAPEHDSKRVKAKVLPDEVTRSKVELDPVWAKIRILTEPNAEVYFVNASGSEVKIGESDADGEYALKKVLDQDDYTIILKKLGFEPYRITNESFALGEKLELEAKMELLPSKISVATTPAGAAVYVDDVRIGDTPIDAFGLTPEEMHTIQVELDGYRGDTREIQLDVGDFEVIDFGELTPRSGELAFDFNFVGQVDGSATARVEDLEISVDGESFRVGDKGLESILEGFRSIEFIHPYYTAEPVRVRISDRETKEVAVEFSPKPAYVQLELSKDLKAAVLINGQLGQPEDGRVQVPSLEPVQLELRIRDHLTVKRQIEIDPGQTMNWTVEPRPIPPPVFEKTWTVPYLGLACVWLPPGSFEMGSPLQEHGRIPNEGPQTSVDLTRGFWIGQFETTQRQYERIMKSNPSATATNSSPMRPVDSLTWQQAKDFCAKLTTVEARAGRLPDGYVYRLPTEAEWEYAARAGTQTAFFFGDQADVSNGNFRGVYPQGWDGGKAASEFYGTRRVGSYKPNAFGLFDTHGNVAEWTLDRYNARLRGGALEDPEPYPSGAEISLRGGSWEDNAKRVRSAARSSASPNTVSNAIGFRLVLAPAL